MPEATQDSYHLLNARLSYDFLDGAAQIALWGRNLTDEVYFNAVIGLAGTLGTIRRGYAEPRTFGAEVTWQF